ncbi:inner membrane transporter RhtA [Bowdeniella nasicola]|uniref:Inner membrane transporter RhtA n=1 Tax=Bowdeniella nasicola TaxID=208480 RepID=A0A1H3X0K0_9ACTO|nr:EamA family transporter [Bowdeniella nasicola]SDZ92907.1 inner membrane transporter RhtA [Bowdeniella nasicola]
MKRARAAGASGALAPALFIAQGFTQYIGASLAVVLFALMPATTVAWWRLAVAAVVLLAWRRPFGARVRWSRRDIGHAALFGFFLATMNILFYLAIARIPMGPAVALEFTGPVLVAALAGRGWRDRTAIALAALGVLAIGGLGLDRSEPGVIGGILFALAAGVAWALYIVIGRSLATSRQAAAPNGPTGIDSLALAMAVGALIYLPMAATTMSPALASWQSFLAVVGVAILSSVFPYAIDQVNFGRLSASAFAILTALLPATSVIVGAIMLSQIPNVFELIGLFFISIAVALTGKRRENSAS